MSQFKKNINRLVCEKSQTIEKKRNLRILFLTSEWPSREYPHAGIFIAKQVEALKLEGVRVDVMDFRGKGNPLKYFEIWVKMHCALRTNRYSLIHAHFGQTGFLAVLQKRVPVVVTFHGSDLYGLDETIFLGKCRSIFLRVVSNFAAHHASEVIAVSERLTALLPSRSHHIIPMGLNINMFRPMPSGLARAHLGWSKSEFNVLFIGDPRNKIKRYDLACEAVALACNKNIKIRLQCCNKVSIEEVPYYMNASDVLLVTSSHEAGPLVVREAIACNLPVVSVDVGDVRKWIGNIEGCIVCEDDRAGTISEALLKVLESDYEINSRDTLFELAQGTIIKKILDVYSAALGSKVIN